MRDSFANRDREPQRLRLTEPLRGVRLVDPASEAALAERLRAQYELGRREAEREWSGQLLSQRRELLELKRGVLAELEQTLPQIRREGEAALVELALEAARRLVAGLPITREMIEAVVREALDEMERDEEMTVLLHPEDLRLLERAGGAAAAESASIEFQAADEVTRGGCILRTRFGALDSRRETKLQRLRDSLRDG